MKKIKSANNQVFDKIISVNKQQENEFNNGQDGAIILSLLVMFFVPFLLMNAARNFLGFDYSFGAVLLMLAVSGLITVVLYRVLKIGSTFAEKYVVLNQLLTRYTPNDKAEFQKFQEDKKADPSNFYELVNNWVETEQRHYAR